MATRDLHILCIHGVGHQEHRPFQRHVPGVGRDDRRQLALSRGIGHVEHQHAPGTGRGACDRAVDCHGVHHAAGLEKGKLACTVPPGLSARRLHRDDPQPCRSVGDERERAGHGDILGEPGAEDACRPECSPGGLLGHVENEQP